MCWKSWVCTEADPAQHLTDVRGSSRDDSRSNHPFLEGLNVNKAELIDAVAANTGQSKSDAGAAVEAVFESIRNAMKSGDTVSLVGFGSFSVSDRAARTGRNPRTGEEIQIAASRAPKFKAGKQLKDAVN